jgi:hypothetical protein
MNDVRVLNWLSVEQIRLLVSVLGEDAKIVNGKFVVRNKDRHGSAILAGPCIGDALTDRPEGCEAIAATVIVVPHVGVRLPPGTSLNYFMESADSLFATPDVAAAIRDAAGKPSR